MVLRALALIALSAALAVADPSSDLRLANTAATAGDWEQVQRLCDPVLLVATLAPADRAEANRLEGLAAFFTHRSSPDPYFLAYLRHDLDGHLDPALYPPEVVNYFNELRARHAAELEALRPRKKKMYWELAPIPVLSQIQNGETTKAIVIGSIFGAFLAANITTYVVLHSWCHNDDHTCDNSGTDHTHAANTLIGFNALAGVGAILTAGYGMYDGVRGYLRVTRNATPYVSSTETGSFVGIVGRF
ncbi:MAG: hypothetical protein QM831_11005 [Kofleriaceae bacterium]